MKNFTLTDLAFLSATSGNFSPLSLSPSLWLDASDATTITSSGGKVSQWNDKSGNGRHVTQATSSAQPTTSTRTLNGKNALDFQGSQILERTGTNILVDPSTGFFTAFAVVATDTIATGVGQIISQDGTVRMPQMLRRQTANAQTVRIIGGIFSDISTTAFTVGSPTVVAARQQLNQLECWLSNNSDGPTATTGTNGTSGSVIRIGATAPTVEQFDGVIGEVIVVPSALSTTDMNKLGEYLAAKWGGSW